MLLISFFLLSPFLKYVEHETEKPIVVVLKDNSASIAQVQTEESYQNRFQSVWSNIKTRLGEDYEIEEIAFGKGVDYQEEMNFLEQETDLSKALQFVSKQYSNQNLGAIILASDGIYNKGGNPLHFADRIKVPIYSIGLGDTTIRKDIAIAEVANNSIAYLGNSFPIKVDVRALKLIGESAKVTVKGNKQVQTKVIRLNKEKDYKEIDFELKANKLGINQITIEVSRFNDEISYSNNKAEVFVDVVDSKKKVLLQARSPHPDLTALKSMIEANDNYEVELSLGLDLNKALKSDLVIIHDAASNNADIAFIEKLKNGRVPILMVIGNRFKASIFNKSSLPIKFSGLGKSQNNALPNYNSEFQLFEMPSDLISVFEKFPPLKAPFGKFSQLKPEGIVVKQKIGMVKTEQPLIYLGNEENYRFGFIGGEGVWRWKLTNYELEEEHKAFGTLVGKMVQYLSVKEDKRLFKTKPVKRQFSTQESISILGELYNKSLENVNTPDVKLKLTDAQGKNYDYVFSRTGNAYALRLENLSEGSYTYKASTTFNGEKFKDKGAFLVKSENKELADLTAKHGLLKQISRKTSGEFLGLSDFNDLTDRLVGENKKSSLIYERQIVSELINLKWLFFLILALLTIEWFVRKRLGAY